jgi:perosamine synthetase
LAQLTKLPDFIRRKRRLAARYAEVFAELDGITFLAEPAGTTSNYWLNSVRIDCPDPALRDELLRAANDDGLQCRPTWRLLSELPMYVDCERGALETAKRLQDSVISIPSSPRLAR